MPNNPITQEELYEYGILRSLTPPAEVVGALSPPYFPAGYFLVPPYDVNGPVLWRKFHAEYISEGLIDPERLGTGYIGDGNLFLADDGTWKVISAGGGGDMLQATYDVDGDGVVDSAERIEIIVRNSTGTTLTKGTVVYLNGATGNRPNAVRAQANTEATSSKTFGFVVADITNNSDGYVASNGTLHDLDTSAFANGAALWLSPTVAGGWTTTVPQEPNYSVFLGYVARSHPTLGRIVILVKNGYELNELHDVFVPSPSHGDLLQWDSVQAYWKSFTPNFSTASNFIIDYDYNIAGLRNGNNTNFSTTVPYKPGTTRVYLNGQRLTPGATYDYLEVSANQIGLFYTPVPSDRLIIEYETI
jgi:hypothetical protein